MAFVLKKLNKLPVRVKGSLPDENGKHTDFDFILHCQRLSQEEVEAEQADTKGSIKDFLRRVTNGWEQVKDEAGVPAAFDLDRFNEMLNNAGMPLVCFTAYMKQIAATSKN